MVTITPNNSGTTVDAFEFGQFIGKDTLNSILQTLVNRTAAVDAKIKTPIFTKYYESSQLSIIQAAKTTLAHNMGVMPKMMVCSYKNITAEYGFTVGQETIPNVIHWSGSLGQFEDIGLIADATNIQMIVGNHGIFIPDLATLGWSRHANLSYWKAIVRAWA